MSGGSRWSALLGGGKGYRDLDEDLVWSWFRHWSVGDQHDGLANFFEDYSFLG